MMKLTRTNSARLSFFVLLFSAFLLVFIYASSKLSSDPVAGLIQF